MRIVGINRSAEYSPNRGEADAAIFEAVASRLEAMGHDVVRLTDGQFQNAFPDDNPTYDAAMDELVNATERFFTMSRDGLTLMLLDILERFNHILCINAPQGISLCNDRHRLYLQLRKGGLQQPPTQFGSLYDDRLPNDPADAFELVEQLTYPVWIKSCYGAARVSEDVVFAADKPQALNALEASKERQVGEVAFCQHITGDLIKFYGVSGTSFFDWAYADASSSKFGQETLNGVPRHYPFNAQLLQDRCTATAERIGVPVFGGDAVIRADGTAVIIDFNDWPSFSRCTQAAADAIATRIINSNPNKTAYCE